MLPILIIAAVLLLLLIRTPWRKPHLDADPGPTAASPLIQETAAHLGQAVQFQTVIDPGGSSTDWKAFIAFGSWIEETYPLVHQKLQMEIVDGYTRIYCWEGSEPSKKPVLFTAHQDVVPAENVDSWTHPPFSGTVADGFLWGRGALDMKGQMIILLETVESLLKTGYQPKQSIYLVFSHDEEVGGSGAAKAAEYFQERGIEFSLLLDEGGCVTVGIMPWIKHPVAAVGVAEKGYVDIELTCSYYGGHSSMPGKRTSLGILSEVLAKVEKHRFPLKLTSVSRQFFLTLMPHMPFFIRVILANLWLFKPVFLKNMAKTPSGNALVRTTTAVTMASGSDAPNSLPSVSSATVNFRLLPGYSPRDIIRHVETIIGTRPVTCTPRRSEPPSFITDWESPAYQLVEQTVREIYPDAVTAPYQLTGGTDARRYQQICSAICRFSPYRLTQREINGMHSQDERISLDNLHRALLFYHKLILRLE